MSQIQLISGRTAAKIPPATLERRHLTSIGALVLISLLASSQPAAAHHAMGGTIPTNFFEGFLSGLAHPVIGLDHLAFVVAIGLLSALVVRGALIPAAFVVAALAGTAIHILRGNLPGAEIVIALSVIGFGVLLILPNRPHWIVLALLGAVAGVFHGYAYGESIVGAGMSPLLAYLLGFTLVQYVVALAARQVGNLIIQQSINQSLPNKIRFAGMAICALGVVFLTNSLVA
ncbi:MAG: HupE/UreJ family protein [Nostocaceae cyanobacterium]|nr:HupE/UreJ family protein [Nostocaceae cyanobacterium]